MTLKEITKRKTEATAKFEELKKQWEIRQQEGRMIVQEMNKLQGVWGFLDEMEKALPEGTGHEKVNRIDLRTK